MMITPRSLHLEADLIGDPFKKYVTLLILVDLLEKRSSNVLDKLKKSSLFWLHDERLFRPFWRRNTIRV